MGDAPPLLIGFVKIVDRTTRLKQNSEMKNLVTTAMIVFVSSTILFTHTACTSPLQKATQAESHTPTDTIPKPVLFARADDLNRTDMAGDTVEQLTMDGRLNWGMKAAGDEWRINALSLPPRVSPDGRRIAFSPDGNAIMVADVRNPAAEPLSVPGSAVFAWSPDSHRLAYAIHEDGEERAQLVVRDLDTSTLLSLLANPTPNISALAWSPDGRRIAFGCCFEQDYSETGELSSGTLTGQLRVVDPVTGQAETVGLLWRSVAGGIQSFCWTEQEQVRPIENANELTAHCSIPLDGSTSPNGQQRFYVSIAPQTDPTAVIVYQLVIEDRVSGEMWRRDLQAGLRPVAWSPDGAFILLDDNGNHTPIWRLGADGAGELEIVIEDGYLLGAVESWD